jgi:microcystin degradation protein MlrC
MRIGIIGLLHESNTFATRPTTLDAFHQDVLLEGDAIRERFCGTFHEIGGFLDGLAECGRQYAIDVTAIPLFVARALPSGIIVTDTWDWLVSGIERALKSAGHLNGLLVACHGATVAQSFPDADGHWLSVVRSRLGPDIPIIGTLDAHANLSLEMVRACTALIAYRTNPHVDQRERGLEAAHLMVRSVLQSARPTMAAHLLPLVIGIERQCTRDPHWTPLYELADRQLAHPNALSNSIVLGFPYADVRELGSAVIAVTDNDPGLANLMASELGRAIWNHRENLVSQLISLEDALKIAAQRTGPVVLLDMGDNVGGGSAADGTFILEAIVRAGIGPSFVCIYDPDAANICMQQRDQGTVTIRVGGRTDNQHGCPVELTGRVRSLHDGRFRESRPRHGGYTEYDQGLTAIVETDFGLTVMLTSRRMVPFSLAQLESCQLDPRRYHILVAKGVHAPVAAYADFCTEFIRVNTPGSTTADLGQLNYFHRRVPLFPFERESTRYDPTVWTSIE